MTETWAGLVRRAASDFSDRSDHYDIELGQPLRRLASLLEQITPEMIADMRSEAGFARDLDEAPVLADKLLSLADLLQSLAATPSEETD